MAIVLVSVCSAKATFAGESLLIDQYYMSEAAPSRKVETIFITLN